MSTEKIKLDRFITMASYVWQSCTEDLAQDELCDSMHLMCPQWKSIKMPFNIDRQMSGVVSDTSLTLSDQSNLTERWREAVQQIKAAGKPFDFWAIFHADRRPEDYSVIIKECQMPREEFDHMIKEVGHLFLGWEIGEWDGLYARDVARQWKPQDIPKTRQEGYDTFMAYLRHLQELLYDNTNALCGMPYAHYFNELPVRMVGAETAQGLLNVQLYVSSLRGACHQYGMEFKLLSSIFDRWGNTDFINPVDESRTPEGGGRAGPFEGHTLGLLQALWITGYLSGAAIMGHEGAFYIDEVENGKRKYSAIGEAMHELTQWARDPEPRGKQIRPLALMLDYYAGWSPPRHYYSAIADCVVWHGVPYVSSDYGMDRAYDCFYPDYLDSGFYRDERGFLTTTPCGDVVDQLLSDATVEQMQAYPVIWLLTDETLADDFIQRLRSYVEAGGHLVIGGQPMTQLASAWFDLRFNDETREGLTSFYGPDEILIREGYHHVRVSDAWTSDWTTHAKTDKNDPLIISKSLGQGKITCLTADHGLTDDMVLSQGKLRDFGPFMPHGYELLNAVTRFARDTVQQHMPIRIQGGPVYYSVNQLDGDDLLVCLYNPGHEPWEGAIQLADNRSCEIVEIKGPWGGVSRAIGGTIHVETNQTKVFKLTIA